jgi:hypothetical protein
MPFSSDAFGAGRLPPRYYDFDFKSFSKRLFKSYGLVRASGQPFVALSQPALVYHIDFRKDTENPGKNFAPFRITADGRLDGFLGWFAARLCEGVTLSNSPYLPLTHWWQLYLPILEQPRYRAGQTILLYLDPNIVADEAQWKYAAAEKFLATAMADLLPQPCLPSCFFEHRSHRVHAPHGRLTSWLLYMFIRRR